MLDQYVRDQLRNALYDLPLTQKGQLAIMSETAGGDAFLDKPSRIVESEGSAISIEAEPCRYTEGRKYKQNKPLIMESTFKSGIWRHAVNKLPAPLLSWAKYCYGEDLKFDHQLIICKQVWDRFLSLDNASGGKKMANKTREKVQQLVWLAVQVTASEIRCIPKEYNAAQLCQLIGIKPDNWQHNYVPRWALLLSVCESLDQELIAHVDRQHKAERDRRRSARVSV